MLRIDTAVKLFVGLRPFNGDESSLFFGRDAEIREILELLQRKNICLLTGKVGAGKTSLVQSGAIPQLNYSSGDTHLQWIPVNYRPGKHPLSGLIATIFKSIETDCTEKFISYIVRESNRNRISSFTDNFLPVRPPNSQFLLVIDPAEDLFIPWQISPEESGRFIFFINELLESSLPFSVIFILDSAFLTDFYNLPDLPVKWKENELCLNTISREQIRTAITEPLQSQGITVSDELLAQLINDISGSDYPLPCLQIIMNRLYNNMENEEAGIISLEHYREMRGVNRVISAEAEAVFSRLNEPEKRLCESIFRSLIYIDDRNRLLCPAINISDLQPLVLADGGQILKLMDLFFSGGRFLVSFSEDIITRETQIFLTHTTISFLWERLREWLQK